MSLTVVMSVAAVPVLGLLAAAVAGGPAGPLLGRAARRVFRGRGRRSRPPSPGPEAPEPPRLVRADVTGAFPLFVYGGGR